MADDIIEMANGRNTTNYQMALPPGNTIPVVPKKLIYVLNGTYFHRSDALYNYDAINYNGPDGIFDKAQFNTWGVNKASEINIFLMGQNTAVNFPQPPPAPQGYAHLSGGASGLGFLDAAGQSTDGSNNIWAKLGNLWRIHILSRRDGSYSDTSGWPWPLDQEAKAINHEIGHLLTLGHPDWGSETCADNPPTTSGGNNTMVSGADQLALTPCQIDRMQIELAARYGAYADCNAVLFPHAFFTVPETIDYCYDLTGAPFDGRGSFHEDRWSLTVVEVNAYNQPAAQPVLMQQANGAVGQLDIGPLVPGKRYMVTLTVYNGTYSHTLTKYVSTRFAQSLPGNPQARTTAAYPNPTAGTFTLPYGAEPEALPVVHDSQGQPVPVESTSSRYLSGEWHVTYRFAKSVRAGLYQVQTGRGATRRVQSLSIQ